MKKWIKDLSVDWTLIVLAYIAIRSLLVPMIHWSEIIGLVIVLAVHYCKRLIPKQKSYIQYDEDFFGMLQDIQTKQKMFAQELSALKLNMGVKKERSFG